MSLTLVTGPANAAKAGHVLGAYRRALGRAPVLVVPTAADVAHYTRELAAEGAVLGGRVTSFAGLVREIARRTGLRERRLGAVQRERVLAGAIADAGLEVLAASAASPGFVRAAGELVAELERAFVTPQRFAQALAAWGAAQPGRAAYAREVAAIYRGYAAALERLGRVDDDLYAWRALDALRAAPGAWGASPVFLYGFDDLALVQRDAVESLARVAGAAVTVSLTYEAGRQTFAGRAGTLEELRPLAGRIVALDAAPDFYAPAARPALHHLERGLFEPGAERREPDGAVRLLEAGGERAEIELLGAEVLGLLGAGVAPEEIAVVFRSPGRYGSLVEQVFGAYGIPVAQDRPVPLAHTALGGGLLALARAALLPGAAGAELIAWLRAPGVLDVPELADELEASVRRAGASTAEEARAWWEERHPSFPLSALDRLRRAAARGERALVAALRGEARRLFERPRRRTGHVLAPEELPDARAFTALSGALDELEELASPGEPATPAPLLDALARLEVRLGDGAAPGAVLVGDPLGIRARRFRAVLLGGLQEVEFPRLTRSDPFLGEERRRELADASGLALPGAADPLSEERYLFYAAASRAEERLVLSYRVSDEEGNPALPSFFVEDVRRLFSDALDAGRGRRTLAEVTWPEEHAPTPAERERARAAAAPRSRPATIGSLHEPAALEALRHREVVSPGTLEAYAACPVRWLVEKELEPDALAPDPEPMRRGSLAHRALEQTFAHLRDEHGTARLSEAGLPEARRVLVEALAAAREELATAPPSAAEDAAARGLAADLERYLAHVARAGESGLEPRHLELRFGMDDGGAPALALDEGRVMVRGVIDRVDVDAAAGTAFVHDYKSGRERREWYGANWAEERQLQVALYLLLVRDRLELEPVGGVYQPLRGQDLRGRGVVDAQMGAHGAHHPKDERSREELAAVLADAEARATALARRLRAGELTPTPATCRRGGGCAYPGICRGAGT